MEDVKGDKCAHREDGHMHKNKNTYQLFLCRYSGEEGVMEDVKRDKCVHKVIKLRVLTGCYWAEGE